MTLDTGSRGLNAYSTGEGGFHLREEDLRMRTTAVARTVVHRFRSRTSLDAIPITLC